MFLLIIYGKLPEKFEEDCLKNDGGDRFFSDFLNFREN